MATPAENLATAYANVCETLAEITENPKPTYNIDGQNILWGDYLTRLTKARTDLAEAINAGAPYELHHRAFT